MKQEIRAVLEQMAESPGCVRLESVFENGKNYERWVNNDKSAKTARKEIKRILKDLWQKGAYNYDQLAMTINVNPREIMYLIDEEYEDRA